MKLIAALFAAIAACAGCGTAADEPSPTESAYYLGEHVPE